jgi:hypothetical protein
MKPSVKGYSPVSLSGLKTADRFHQRCTYRALIRDRLLKGAFSNRKGSMLLRLALPSRRISSAHRRQTTWESLAVFELLNPNEE